MSTAFSPVFYLPLAALLLLQLLMWRWFLRRPGRTTAQTVLVSLFSLTTLSPVFFLLYQLLKQR